MRGLQVKGGVEILPTHLGVARGGEEWEEEQRWDGVKVRERVEKVVKRKKPSLVLSKQGIKSCHVYF